MSLIVFKTWFLLGVGVAVVGLAIFGFARLSKVPVEWERRRRFFSLIGSLWLGISFFAQQRNVLLAALCYGFELAEHALGLGGSVLFPAGDVCEARIG